MIIKRSTLNKTDVINNSAGKRLYIIGMVLVVLGGFGFIGGAAQSASGADIDGSLVAMSLIFLVVGPILLTKANKIKAESESIKKYLAVIINGGERNLDAVASATAKPYDTVKKDVQKMINDDVLKNAYIDEKTKNIVLAGDRFANMNAGNLTDGVAFATKETRVVECPGCGANNTVSGDLGKCEYCGNPLK